jgi:hypothetical protein
MFLFLYFVFFYKIRKQEQVLPRGCVGIGGRGEVVGKGDRMMNTVQIM